MIQEAQPYAKIVSFSTRAQGIDMLRWIEYCARVSHASEEAMSDTSWEKFLTAVVLGHADWSVTEHSSVTVEIFCDRGITHEIVRHRHFAYTQSSTRFINYAKQQVAKYIRPKFAEWAPSCIDPELANKYWEQAMEAAEGFYQHLLGLKVPPQLARSVFPTALGAKIVMTGNLRAWRYFFLARTSSETHPQCRELTIPLLKEFQDKIPLLFADIEPLKRQKDNFQKAY